MRRRWSIWNVMPGVRSHPEPAASKGSDRSWFVSFVYGRPRAGGTRRPRRVKVRTIWRGGRTTTSSSGGGSTPCWAGSGPSVPEVRGPAPRRSPTPLRSSNGELRARLAGLGWNRQKKHDADRPTGWEASPVLGALLVDLRTPPPTCLTRQDTAGTCTRCLDGLARPTPSSVPYQLDARPVHSATGTIEHKGRGFADAFCRRTRRLGLRLRRLPRTSAPGTARHPLGGRPSSTLGPSGPTPT